MLYVLIDFRHVRCGSDFVFLLSHRVLSSFFFSSRRRHTRCALVTGVHTCALPIAPLFGLAARRQDAWKIQLSRTVAFQSLSLAAIGGYLILKIGRAPCRERVWQDV